MTHVETELSVIKIMLSDVERRGEELGSRIAARDIENCLEDTVSIYEAVLRALVIRALISRGIPKSEIHLIMKRRIGNKFQNIRLSSDVMREEIGLELFESMDPKLIESLKHTFGKRHPITHNLGIIDRKYLEGLQFAEQEGREIRVSQEEIMAAIDTSFTILASAHKRLFMDAQAD